MNLVRLANGGTTHDAFKAFTSTKKLVGMKLDPNELVELNDLVKYNFPKKDSALFTG